MREYKIDATIDAPPESIWALLTDAAGFPEWNPAVEKVEGRIALGEKVTVHTTFSSQAFPVKVTEFVPNQKMVWTGGMPLGLFKGERTFTLTPQDNGATQFAMREAFSGPLLPLMGRSIPDLTPSFEQYVTGLKSRVEGAG